VPKTAEHLAQSRHNLRFAQSFDLEQTEYLDWVVTVYFYAAMHLVDAVLYFKDRYDPPYHEMRRDCFRTKPYLHDIRYSYKQLKDRSEDARYRLIPFTKAQVENEIIPLYRKIEAHILGLLPGNK
jgi:hypothetical protein